MQKGIRVCQDNRLDDCLCSGNCWFVCMRFRERGETSLFQYDRICNPKCKMRRSYKKHIDARSSKTALLKTSSALSILKFTATQQILLCLQHGALKHPQSIKDQKLRARRNLITYLSSCRILRSQYITERLFRTSTGNLVHSAVMQAQVYQAHVCWTTNLFR